MKKRGKKATRTCIHSRLKFVSSKHSQAWGMDLIIAVVIFSVGLIVFYVYSLNNPREAKETIDILSYEAKILASSILSEGYPKDWNAGNVVTIGILSENKINETKLERFYNLSTTNYEKTKRLFNTKYDYYFFLNETMIVYESIEIEGLGKEPTNQKNLVKTTHFTIYKNKPVTAYLYVWD